MSMTKYRFVGLDRDVWLPSDITVEIAIVPASMTNIRSNQRETGQTSYTQHETYNFAPGAGADMHKRWLHSGAGGAYVGFNFVVDDKKIIQLTPLNEVTWAAGTPDGNRYSYHTELCVNDGIDHTKARRNAAALAGGILAVKGWDTSRLYQHNRWTGKDCPFLLRRNGLWAQFVNQVATFIEQAKKGSNGVSDPSSSPASFKVGDTLRVTDVLNVRQGYATSHPVVTKLQPDSKIKVIADGEGNFTKSNDGYTWYNISFDGGTGWSAGDWFEKVDPPKEEVPSAGWPYPNPVVPPFWDKLTSEGVTHVFTDGFLWIRTNGLYKVKEGGTPRLRYAAGEEKVGPDLAAGTEVSIAAVGQGGADKKAYAITEGLTRIRLDDLIYVEEK